jgi:hypothetical protein
MSNAFRRICLSPFSMKKERERTCCVCSVKGSLVGDLAGQIISLLAKTVYGGGFRLGNVCVLGDSL